MANPNTNGVLDKFRIRNVVKSGFNPGRNQSWDWNELLTTIETEFEGNFDLATLQADITTNKNAIAANLSQINTNKNGVASNLSVNNTQTSAINVNTSEMSKNKEKIALICDAITNGLASGNFAGFQTVWNKVKPCA